MRVKQLIQILQGFDPKLEVVVDGYEGGCDEPIAIEEIVIEKDINEEDYFGKHEEVYNRETLVKAINSGSEVADAVIIRRG